MNGKSQPSHTISGVFVFLLLGLFAVFSTLMVLLGARVYRGTVNAQQAHNAERLAPAYVRSMVRAHDEADTVQVEEVNGIQTVAMYNTYDTELYVTRLYAYEGQLYEWFTEAAEPFEPENGEPVCPCDGMTAELQDGLLRLRLTADSRETDVGIALKAEQRGGV